jgi:putative spermidine/putrescine transport system substrate-binding protein
MEMTRTPPRALTVLTYGGMFRQAVDTSIARPFQEEEGVRVELVEVNNIDVFDRCRAAVESGQPAYDIAMTNPTYFQKGVGEGLWEELDHTYFDPGYFEEVPETFRFDHGVASGLYSNNLVFNSAAFPGSGRRPSSWIDFWDVESFPGLRSLPVCESGINPLPEIALLADGVLPADLYPLDMQRAVRKLAQLGKNLTQWRDGSESVRLVAEGPASIGLMGNGRAHAAIKRGARLEIVWAQTRCTFDLWYILRGTPLRREAMQFLAYSQRVEVQAAMARSAGLAPTRTAAYEFLDEATARELPTYPENAPTTFMNDEGWWALNRERWVECCRTIS